MNTIRGILKKIEKIENYSVICVYINTHFKNFILYIHLLLSVSSFKRTCQITVDQDRIINFKSFPFLNYSNP